MIPADLLQTFQDELRDLLESLDRGLLDLRGAPQDGALVAQVFRDLHTIKGNAAMFGLSDLSDFVHGFETAFDRIRSGAAEVTPEVIRLSLLARDEIPGLVAGQPDTEGRRPAIIAALEAELGRALRRDEDVAEAPAEEAPAPVAQAVGSVLTFSLQGRAFETGQKPELLIRELAALGATDLKADLSDLPGPESLDPAQCHIRWTCRLPATVRRSDVEEVFLFADVSWDLVPVAAPAAPVPDVPPYASEPEPEPVAATIRVPAARLDALMDSVGELVIVEARLTELARQSSDPALLATAEQITRLAAGLRDTTMTMRMVPMRTLVGRFRRLVSEAADALQKPVQFTIEGEETEFDKTLIEKLADPIVHLLRNAIDHGIELPGTREAAGKPTMGNIWLSAEQAGTEVLVRIRDDGRGMNPATLRAKAVAMGLIGADAALTDAQLCNLIFEPGFSTAGTITQISGRGVGMDVVRRTIEALRGTITLDTAEGQGTTVTLRLPLTLAIIDGLLIEVAGERYTLPMECVQEIVELPVERQVQRSGGEFLDIRGQFVPFIRLHKVLDCAAPAAGRQNVVVTKAGEEKVGIVVDHILGTNQVVIKQMSKLHRGVTAVSGASILGDGGVALILDVAQAVALARRRGLAADPSPQKPMTTEAA
ncbi:MAG: chemotaxis protein CheA [Cypionkella sp.]|nr:chemotaxis protein CheA [Cypionkella sp.]